MAQARADERDANQIRPMKCELECVAKSDGSCQFSCGETVVIAAIYGKKPAFDDQLALNCLCRLS
jgi:ribonuclease PH